MSDIKITALNVIENQRNPYIINDVIKFKITLDKTVKGHIVAKPFLVFKLNNTISKCALLVTTTEQTTELMFEYTIQQGDLDLIGIKLSKEPFSQGIIYYDHPSLKITGLTGEALDTKFSNTLPEAIKIDTRGDPVNYQTNKYLVPIKVNNNILNNHSVTINNATSKYWEGGVQHTISGVYFSISSDDFQTFLTKFNPIRYQMSIFEGVPEYVYHSLISVHRNSLFIISKCNTC